MSVQEFPQALYRGDEITIVASESERDDAKLAGWSVEVPKHLWASYDPAALSAPDAKPEKKPKAPKV